jgi:phage shock protein PspC (stress-responsive transcriptional regulator)
MRTSWHLHRSAENRMIAGVCGGIAQTFGVDPLLVRVAALALLIPFSFITALAYVALWLLLPLEG